VKSGDNAHWSRTLREHPKKTIATKATMADAEDAGPLHCNEQYQMNDA
jgi:hypothetical protein